MVPPTNSLAAKVSRSKISNAEMASRLASANAGIAAGADGFIEWALADLVKAQGELEKVAKATGDEAAISEIFRTVHDLKGQGGTFGYPLVTAISAPIADFLRISTSAPSVDQINVIKVYLAALHAVLTQNIKGEGGKMGEQLLQKLSQVISRVPPLT